MTVHRAVILQVPMGWCTNKCLTVGLCVRQNLNPQIYNEGISLYFSSGWNILDICVVDVCLISSGYALTMGAGAQPWTQFACMICWLEVFNMLRGEHVLEYSRKKERKKDRLTCCRLSREHHWPLWGITALSAQLRHPVAWYGIFVRLVVKVTGSSLGVLRRISCAGLVILYVSAPALALYDVCKSIKTPPEGVSNL